MLNSRKIASPSLNLFRDETGELTTVKEQYFMKYERETRVVIIVTMFLIIATVIIANLEISILWKVIWAAAALTLFFALQQCL